MDLFFALLVFLAGAESMENNSGGGEGDPEDGRIKTPGGG